MTFGEAVRAAAARLSQAGLDTPDLDARALALDAFGLDHAALLAAGRAEAPPAALRRLEGFVARRIAREPVARIRGRREFWGLSFALSPDTLAPRPETETVVEAALAAQRSATAALSILDLGTGSGCLLLALLSELPNASGVGVDRSPAAAATARANAASLGLGDRAGFLAGDWADALRGPFDLVVSNPPYIRAGDIPALEPEVRDHDPHLALDGGPDGLAAYASIMRRLPRLLAPGGIAALELGAGQAEEVSALADAEGLATLRVVADLASIPRALLLARG